MQVQNRDFTRTQCIRLAEKTHPDQNKNTKQSEFFQVSITMLIYPKHSKMIWNFTYFEIYVYEIYIGAWMC